ncbi:alpha-hydroxy-acid oxidizing protein [Streptomyces enissocaesilis]|uniref:Lactate 2-monooxygenase n=1 Tax=Streptomyces enissocaesilis TaxID=332589 RepID=A0ABP6K7Z3_9ACTN
MNLVGGFQESVYWQALEGEPVRLPFGAREWEETARSVMPAEAFGYVAGGAGTERAVAANRAVFAQWSVTPRVLRDGSASDIGASVLGTAMSAPVLLAPLGVAEIAHREGERAVARAAADEGVVQILSTVSSVTLEEVAVAAPAGRRWFQLYWPEHEDLARSFVARAEQAGYGALVVTADTYLLGWRPRDLAAGYFPFFAGKGLANYFSDPVFCALLGENPHASPEALRKAVITWGSLFNTATFTPGHITRLKAWTALPVVVKGVCDPREASRLIDAGADAVIVSNHGGRQLDNARPALDCLPPVVRAARGHVPVLFDSGIRTGSDVYTALALGADAVLLGRPWMYALAVAGQSGVRHTLRCLKTDLTNCLQLTGHHTHTTLTPDDLHRAPTPHAPPQNR